MRVHVEKTAKCTASNRADQQCAAAAQKVIDGSSRHAAHGSFVEDVHRSDVSLLSH
jgi:hypothetical protein